MRNSREIGIEDFVEIKAIIAKRLGLFTTSM